VQDQKDAPQETQWVVNSPWLGTRSSFGRRIINTQSRGYFVGRNFQRLTPDSFDGYGWNLKMGGDFPVGRKTEAFNEFFVDNQAIRSSVEWRYQAFKVEWVSKCNQANGRSLCHWQSPLLMITPEKSLSHGLVFQHEHRP
jgi:hypothetical protein